LEPAEKRKRKGRVWRGSLAGLAGKEHKRRGIREGICGNSQGTGRRKG
jgi:hypothetical protein